MKENYKRLSKHTLILFIGSFGSKSIQFLMLPIFTSCLSTQDYGKIDLITTTIDFLLPIFTLNISDAIFRFTLDELSFENKRELLSSSLFVMLCGFIVWILVNILIGIPIFKGYLFYSLMIFLLNAIYINIQLFIRGEKRLILYALIDIIKIFLFASISIILVKFLNKNIYGYLLSLILSSLLVIIIMSVVIKIYKYISIKAISFVKIKEMIMYSITLLPTVICWWVINTSNRYMISFFVSLSATGIFVAASKFPAMINMINGIFYQAWQISAVENYNKKDKDIFYSNVYKYYYILLFGAIIVFSFILKPMIFLMTSNKYHEAWVYLPIMVIGVLFSAFSSFFGVGYIVSKKTKGAFISAIIGAVINVGLCLLTVPYLKTYGAVIASTISFFIMWIFRLVDTRKFFRININKIQFINMILLCICSLLINYLKEVNLRIVIQSIILISFILLNKNDIRIIIKKNK